jgi:hypothetical protein
MRFISIVVVLALLPAPVLSQYWGERALEKTFEQSDLFYNPYYLNPFGIKSFRDVPAGFIDNPLSNLNLNPALFPDREQLPTYLYIDFRGDRKKPEVIDYYWGLRAYDWASVDRLYMGYIDPRWYTQTREEPEPFFSAAILFHPSMMKKFNLFLGASYQLVYTDERYYTVPADIYKAEFGYLADGARASGVENMPVIDRYKGSDFMHHQGHLYSLFLGIEPISGIRAGIRASAVILDRDGSRGNNYMMDDYYGQGDISRSMNWEDRDQSYSHFDISGGINARVGSELRIGATAGYLTGSGAQNLDRTYYYRYQRDPSQTPTSWWNSFMESGTGQRWDQDGKTMYGGIDFIYYVSETDRIILNVSTRKSEIDLVNSSSIRDTSYYSSRWEYDDWLSEHRSNSYVIDTRSGTGTRNRSVTQLMLVYQWQLTDRLRLEWGLVGTTEKTTVDTRETVFAEWLSDYESMGTWPYAYYDFRREDKDLAWNFEADRMTLQIPVVLHAKLSDKFDLTAGINRRLRGWTIEDATTAFLRYRERILNGVYSRTEMIAERYTNPRERLTETTTTGIVGLRLNLTTNLGINTLVEPDLNHFPKLHQWWLSFEMRP